MKSRMTIALLLMLLIGCETSPYITEEGVTRISNSHPGYSGYQVMAICENKADAYERGVEDKATSATITKCVRVSSGTVKCRDEQMSTSDKIAASFVAGLFSNSKEVYKNCLLEFGFEYTTRQIPNPNYQPQ